MGGPDGQYQLVWTLLHQDWDAHGRMGRRVFDLAALNKKLKSLIIFHGSDERSGFQNITLQFSFSNTHLTPDSTYSLHISTSTSQAPLIKISCLLSMFLHTSVWKGHTSSDLMICSFTWKHMIFTLLVHTEIHAYACTHAPQKKASSVTPSEVTVKQEQVKP